ncbi:response regulator transcription factor [Acidaminobacter sp. JC074]|uniref:response regulator n=1 Tax=Acidaminobacter sp. JC074 TaxID=2530199 RepID=UPI001F101E8B|nr:response regulator transcription factor [Acidaminobacter sp. JC074]MCH4888139.1 response regulator transcription factor [Acidaminobacter sp. JC074]
MKRKILVADDEPRMLMLIKDFLSTEYEVILASDGKEAFDLLNKEAIDMAILDIMMPGYTGLDLIPIIKEKSQIPIILLTAKTTELDELTGFISGADEYIKKPFSPSILRARVTALMKRTYHDDKPEIYGHIQIKRDQALIYLDEDKLDLSSTEYKLLLHFIDNKGLVFSRNALLDAVWGQDYIGTDRTVDTTINRLRIKLKKASYYIETIRGLGYRFEVHHD